MPQLDTHTHTQSLPQIRGSGHFLISDTHDPGVGNTGALPRSARLSTQKKVLSQEKLWERGCGIGGRMSRGEGAAQPALGPPRCVYSDTVSSCPGEGKQI